MKSFFNLCYCQNYNLVNYEKWNVQTLDEHTHCDLIVHTDLFAYSVKIDLSTYQNNSSEDQESYMLRFISTIIDESIIIN